MVCSQNRGMILMLILALSVAAQDQMAPDGLRLALGLDPSAMRVAWQTYDVLKAETKVMWGSKADDLEHSAVGGATVFTSDPERNWTMLGGRALGQQLAAENPGGELCEEQFHGDEGRTRCYPGRQGR